jgi:hypothetical protein
MKGEAWRMRRPRETRFPLSARIRQNIGPGGRGEASPENRRILHQPAGKSIVLPLIAAAVSGTGWPRCSAGRSPHPRLCAANRSIRRMPVAAPVGAPHDAAMELRDRVCHDVNPPRPQAASNKHNTNERTRSLT